MKKQHLKIFFLAIFSIAIISPNYVFAADPSTLPLMSQSDLEYVGAFKVPQGKYGILANESAKSFGYGGGALTYDSTRNGLILTTSSTAALGKMVAEISIPQAVNTSDINSLNVASILQNPINIASEKDSNSGPDLSYGASSTSMTMSAGSGKTFTLLNTPRWAGGGTASLPSGIVKNLSVKIESTLSPGNYMLGTVTTSTWKNDQGTTSGTDTNISIGTTTLVVTINSVVGSGTFDTWNVTSTGSAIMHLGNIANLGLDLTYNSSSLIDMVTGWQHLVLLSIPRWAGGGPNGTPSGFVPNMTIKIASASDPNNNYMTAVIASSYWVNSNNIVSPTDTSVGQSDLVVNVTDVVGSGSFSDWIVTSKGSGIANGGQYGNFLPWKGKLIGNAWAYYDGMTKSFNSHYTASLNWDSEGASGFQGFYAVGQSPISLGSANGGFVGGYMTNIPADWQSILGGPVLTGLSGTPTNARSSHGPAAWVFNPDDLGIISPAPAEMLVGYPNNHSTLALSTGNLLNNSTSQTRGLVFPVGTRSVLFFGRHGLAADNFGAGTNYTGVTTYGPGTSVISEAGRTASSVPNTCGSTTVSGGDVCSYDPVDSSKGVHGYPYVYRVWAYDANDLALVKQGAILTAGNRPANLDSSCAEGTIIQAWCLKPYATWDLSFPLSVANAQILGATYDSVNQLLYISEYAGNPVGFDPLPLIQVFHVNTNIVPDVTAPAAPSGLVVN
jgi:hypothetical protein